MNCAFCWGVWFTNTLILESNNSDKSYVIEPKLKFESREKALKRNNVRIEKRTKQDERLNLKKKLKKIEQGNKDRRKMIVIAKGAAGRRPRSGDVE